MFPTHTDSDNDLYHIDGNDCYIWNSFRLQWVIYATRLEAEELGIVPY